MRKLFYKLAGLTGNILFPVLMYKKKEVYGKVTQKDDTK